MTGEAEFNEVFFTDVRIPDAERLGDVGEGWRVALTTLMNERVSIGGAIPPREGGLIREALHGLAGDGARPSRRRSATSSSELWIEAEVLRLTNIRAGAAALGRHARPRGLGQQDPGGRAQQAGHELRRRPAWAPTGCSTRATTWTAPSATMAWDCPQKAFLRMRANSIEGGTTEVMKNILGERMLGLPGDVRVDKELRRGRTCPACCRSAGAGSRSACRSSARRRRSARG